VQGWITDVGHSEGSEVHRSEVVARLVSGVASDAVEHGSVEGVAATLSAAWARGAVVETESGRTEARRTMRAVADRIR
jgi:hypothetical protein